MIHFLFEGNRELLNRKFVIPKGIRSYLTGILNSYTGDKNVEGYKRLNNILEMDSISYNEMKRIKNFFDNYKGTQYSAEYTLNGGEPMMNWVNNTLNTATSAIEGFKKAKKDAGMKNAYIRPHEKQRQIRKDKPTIAKIQTKNVSDKISNNDIVRFENKERKGKVIRITESLYRQIIGENKRYEVNMDVELAKKGRTAAKITPKEFEEKLSDIWNRNTTGDDDRKFNIRNFVNRFCSPYEETPELSELHNDLEKVKFDFENCESIGEIRSTNGISYLIGYAGGDWESPVLFFVYWDGKKLRAYIPIHGNAVNRKTNSAFSQSEEDKDFLRTQNIPEEEIDKAVSNISYNEDECIKDFKARIGIK